jgi:hypothetical protein
MKRTFVIGDVHGHVDRLQDLLTKAGIVPGDDIVQLGDLGHFGLDETQDEECYLLAQALGIHVLWGNHDFACVAPQIHGFRGFRPPSDRMLAVMAQVPMAFALARHGFLLTHAGLHPKFLVPGQRMVEEIAERLNNTLTVVTSHAVNAIGVARGGSNPEGGILWRDDREALARINQVFGHSRGLVRRSLLEDGTDRWCIDVADKGDPGNLAGLWLPDLKLVAVGPDAPMYEQWIDV